MITLGNEIDYENIYKDDKVFSAAKIIANKFLDDNNYELYVNKFGEFEHKYVYNKSIYQINIDLKDKISVLIDGYTNDTITSKKLNELVTIISKEIKEKGLISHNESISRELNDDLSDILSLLKHKSIRKDDNYFFYSGFNPTFLLKKRVKSGEVLLDSEWYLEDEDINFLKDYLYIHIENLSMLIDETNIIDHNTSLNRAILYLEKYDRFTIYRKVIEDLEFEIKSHYDFSISALLYSLLLLVAYKQDSDLREDKELSEYIFKNTIKMVRKDVYNMIPKRFFDTLKDLMVMIGEDLGYTIIKKVQVDKEPEINSNIFLELNLLDIVGSVQNIVNKFNENKEIFLMEKDHHQLLKLIDAYANSESESVNKFISKDVISKDIIDSIKVIESNYYPNDQIFIFREKD